MDQRVICFGYDAGEPAIRYEPDPEAPSVREVVEVLREASTWLQRLGGRLRAYDGGESEDDALAVSDGVKHLIAQLEDSDGQ